MIKRLGQTMTPGPMSLTPPKAATPEGTHGDQATRPNSHLQKLLESLGQSDEDPSPPIVELISVAQLQPGHYQPRQAFDDERLEDLAESIRSAGGIIQPIIVRTVGRSRYEIVAGERRWRAARIIDMETVPCIVRNDLTDDRALIVALVENLQREDLNPIEAAVSISKLVEQFKFTHHEAALALGKSRASISNLLRLLTLTIPVIEAVRVREIDMGHARALIGLDEELQLQLLELITQNNLTVRDVEVRVKRLRKTNNVTPKPPEEADIEIENAAEILSRRVGGWVDVKKSVAGKVVITLRDTASLQRLITLLGE